MDRRAFVAAVGTAGVFGTAGCSGGGDSGDATASRSSEPGDGRERSPPGGADEGTTTGGSDAGRGTTYRVGTEGFERLRDGVYERLEVRGVNLGMAKPGRFPGEAAITRAEYDRWLSDIGDVANVVRTYTIHPPAFYRALSAYNEGRDDPLLLLQGTWVPANDLGAADTATDLSTTVDRELRRTVDAVHGATTLPERPGHAAGTYDVDVSGYTLGFLFGIEWPPEVVADTNERGNGGEYSGTYLRTQDGSAFERWLAGRLDGTVSHEMENYGVQRPVSFVNWVTTDPLSHPYEPFEQEDAVGIDPDSLRPTDAFDAGTVAAYHVYPYYPDLLNETPEYVQYTDHRGEPNNYAGYLNDLVGNTDHPVLVAEFGVPSSRGTAHRNVHGRDQGRHTERRQGEIVAAMFEDIRHAGTAGGVMFSWQTEWFKRTWNLDARSVPGRRPYWSNVETPEQGFGLLSFDPVGAVSLDGSTDGWSDAGTRQPATGGDAAPSRTLTGLRVTHDFEGLCFRLEFDRLPEPVDWSRMNALVTVGSTGRSNPLPFGADATATADFVVRLGGPGDSRLLVESRYDAFAREFGEAAGLELEDYRDGRAGFVPVREPINLGYTVPETGETVPFEAVETGRLRYGNGNPESAAYDSLTDVHVDAASDTVELRVPWLLLNVADPSSRRRIATDWESGLEAVGFDTLSVGAATYAPDSEGDAIGTNGATNLTHGVPGRVDTRLETFGYTWDRWDIPAYEPRLKRSYDVLRKRLG